MLPLPCFYSSNQYVESFALGGVGPGAHQPLYLFQGSAILAVGFDRSVHE
jgi:hypothetical protein